MKKKTIIIISCLAILTLVLAFIIFYINMNRPSTVLYIDPQTINGTVGQNFTVNICISHVADLYGYEFKLGWNSSLLDAINVTEGTFLKQGGTTLFSNKINNTEGHLLVDCTRLGNVPGVSGNGILATINLYVKGEGECILDLYDTVLINSLEESIPHVAADGHFGP